MRTWQYAAETFAELGRGLPEEYAEIARLLGRLVVEFQVDEDAAYLTSQQRHVEVGPRPKHRPNVSVRVSRGDLNQLLAGTRNLDQLVQSPKVMIYGRPRELVRVGQAMERLMAAALRLPGVTRQFYNFRTNAEVTSPDLSGSLLREIQSPASSGSRGVRAR